MIETMNDLLSFVENTQDLTVRLYLVTRTLKQGVSVRTKTPNKYEYSCFSINTNQDIQNELLSLFEKKINHYTKDDKYTLDEYSIVTDDIDKKILTYTKKEQIGSFMHIVDVDLKNSLELPTVKDLSTIVDDLWAYIIELSVGEQIVCGLRRISPSKIMIPEKHGPIAAYFNIKEQSLALSNNQSIVFDNNLDALYADGTFFIIQKTNFEAIVGLEYEYKETAKIVAEKLIQSPNIAVKFDLMSKIEVGGRFIRKLAKIMDVVDSIDNERIGKMQKTATSFNLQFVVKAGEIIVENEKEFDILIKLIDDYYVESRQTGKKYEASSKKEVKG